jgi:hypothetical protein
MLVCAPHCDPEQESGNPKCTAAQLCAEVIPGIGYCSREDDTGGI